MRNLSVGLLTSLASLASAWAQNSPLPPLNRHSVVLRAGIGSISVNDQNASPLLYSSRPLHAGLAYHYSSPKAELQAECQLAYSPLFEARAYPGRVIHYSEELAVPMEGSLVIGSAFVNYLVRIHSSAKSTILVGTGLHHTIQYPLEAPFAGLSMITSLPVVAKGTYWFGPKNRLTGQVGYALLGVVTRLPWHNTLSLPEVGSQFGALYKNNTHLEAGHRLHQLTASLDLKHGFGRHLDLGLTYQLNWLAYPQPRPLTSWANNLQLTTTVNF